MKEEELNGSKDAQAYLETELDKCRAQLHQERN